MSAQDIPAQPGAKSVEQKPPAKISALPSGETVETAKSPSLDTTKDSKTIDAPKPSDTQPIGAPASAEAPFEPSTAPIRSSDPTSNDAAEGKEDQDSKPSAKRRSSETQMGSIPKKSRKGDDDPASKATKESLKKSKTSPEVGKKKLTVSKHLNIDNTLVFESCETLKQRHIGSVVYEPEMKFMRRFDGYYNGVLRILIRASDLNSEAIEEILSERPLWGTNVYTDDSNLIACLLHCGSLQRDQIKDSADLCVTAVVLPALREYRGSYMGCINSRTWSARHDGFSFQIQKAEWIKPQSAAIRACNSRKRCNEWLRSFKKVHSENYFAELLH